MNPNGSVIESSMRCGRECTVEDPACDRQGPKQWPSSAHYARSCPVAPANRGQAAVKPPRTDLAWGAAREAAIVREAMALLSGRQRAIIYRAHYLGRTTTQIAAELGTNGEVVKHELHRALHALRMNLQSAGGGR